MGNERHVLVVDDDENLTALLVFTLKNEGYRVSHAGSGKDMFARVRSGTFDLILLDLTLPDEDGLALTRQLRTLSSMPIIVLTGRADRGSLLTALELGVDDYITKPFDPQEVLLRVKNVLARSARSGYGSDKKEKALFQFEGWSLDLEGRTLLDADGTEVRLTPGEFRILAALIRNPGRAVSRDSLLDAVAVGDEAPSPRMIDVYVTQLRSKIEADRKNPRLIQTVREFGYKFGGKLG